MQEEQQKFLNHLATELNTQDNAITSDPVFVVYDWRSQYFPANGMDGELATEIAPRPGKGGSGFVWVTEDNEYEADADEAKLLEAKYEEDWDNEQVLEQEGVKFNCHRLFKFRYQQFRGAFFTREAAESLIACQKHNMYEPFIFVESGYYNQEWKELRKILGKGALCPTKS